MTAFFFTTIPLQNEWNLLPPKLQSKAEEGRKASQLSEVGISQRVACSGARQAGRPRRAAAWRTQPTMSTAAVQPEPRPHPVPTLPEGFPIVPGEAWGKMLGLVVHTWDSSTKEAEAGEWKVVNQHRLHQDGLRLQRWSSTKQPGVVVLSRDLVSTPRKESKLICHTVEFGPVYKKPKRGAQGTPKDPAPT